MATRGPLRRVAHGYYLLPPLEHLDEPGWRPPVEHLALGIAVADHEDRAALMGLSAARHHGAVPRAHATAWVAIEAIRRPLDCGRFGRVVFVSRDLDRLDLVRARTPLADGWVTSVEQTVVDLARRPDYAGGPDLAREALSALWGRADEDLVDELASRQRGRAALLRLRTTLPEAER
jgi:predicted transcriptional regulator of viral defense system